MSSRDHILKTIRRHLVEAVDLPSLDQPWITFADRQQQFADVLDAIGGRCVRVPDVAALNAALTQIPAYADGTTKCSLVPGVGESTFDLNAITDPHDLADVDYAILPGEFAVAENAAVWVTDAHLRHRALYFIPQHLALVVPASEVVNSMHEAYERLSFNEARYGAFIAGPSKTADIEQALVIGAHGARSMHVFLIDSPGEPTERE